MLIDIFTSLKFIVAQKDDPHFTNNFKGKWGTTGAAGTLAGPKHYRAKPGHCMAIIYSRICTAGG
jgi:hypothetical protein